MQRPTVMVRSAAEIGRMCGFYEPEVVKVPISADAGRLMAKFKTMSDEELSEIAARAI